jgi:hypothetical protein
MTATIADIRVALANQLDTIPGLRAYANRMDQVDPPSGGAAVMILPPTGSFLRYGSTFTGSAEITLRAVLITAKTDSTAGQAALDPFLEVAGAASVYANLQANNTLGGVVDFAALMEATGYGPLTIGAIEYLGCHLIINVGI